MIDETFARSVTAGLTATPKCLESKYLYDARGAELFDAICELPEYYPTRTETRLLEAHAGEIARVVGPGAALIELGSGASTKTRLLLDALERPASYVPVDISKPYLDAAAARLRREYPDLAVLPVIADFTASVRVPAATSSAPRLLFFPGSTIGNLEPEAAVGFLASMRESIRPDLFVIGVDLIKPLEVLLPAYDDAQGVTAAFNLNLLTRINRELGGGFHPERFAHEARWSREHGRIEMHLVSREGHEVSLLGRRIHFDRGESIHTESSYKYTRDRFTALAEPAGWRLDRWWADDERLFALAALRPVTGS